MGHEGAGIVEEVGPEVRNHKVGDRVAWGWVISHSLCLYQFHYGCPIQFPSYASFFFLKKKLTMRQNRSTAPAENALHAVPATSPSAPKHQNNTAKPTLTKVPSPLVQYGTLASSTPSHPACPPSTPPLSSAAVGPSGTPSQVTTSNPHRLRPQTHRPHQCRWN